MNVYEEKYGEIDLTDSELERVQERIDNEELLNEYKYEIRAIKELIEHEEDYTKEELVGELKWIIGK